MARRWQRDHGKERYWRRMLRLWGRSGHTIRDFCAAHQLAEPLFYAWRRTIQQRDQQAERTAKSRRGAATTSVGGGAVDRGQAEVAPAFVPVTLVGALAPLEVVLRDGRVVRVPAGFDAAALRQLLAILNEAPSC